MRRLYYRDSYGYWRRDQRRDQRSEQPRSMPARLAVIALLVLAGIVVLASLSQSLYHAARP